MSSLSHEELVQKSWPDHYSAILTIHLVQNIGQGTVNITHNNISVPRVVKYARIKQSLAYWCLNATDWKWDIDRICATAKGLGCESVELVPPQLWNTLRQYGLKNALAYNGMPDPPFAKGLNNLCYQEEVIARTKAAIDEAAEFGVPNVIAFTGDKWRDADDAARGELSLQEGASNCVSALSELGRYASGKKVTVCLEHLNSRDTSHPMKGHPGYQGDNIDYCAEIIYQVNSPHVKLLFDVYHVAVMHGDVVRRIRQYRDIIGHVHTAGNPGRGELDERQEINYPAVMRVLLEVGYAGYVGQEFIPTRDPLAGLVQAVSLCDVE